MKDNMVIDVVKDIVLTPIIQIRTVYMKDDHGGNNLWIFYGETENTYLVVSRNTELEINKDSVYYDNFGKCYCNSDIRDINEINDEIESESKWEEWFSVGDDWTDMWKYCGELSL